MSGQATETFPMLRSCLEYALYAVHIHGNPSYAEIWERRHESDASLAKARKCFRHKCVMETLARFDIELHKVVRQLYEQTIDFGGHPNARGVSMSMSTRFEGSEVVVRNQFLHGDSAALRHSLGCTIRIGINSLMAFRLIFKERFDDAGISDSIDALNSATQ